MNIDDYISDIGSGICNASLFAENEFLDWKLNGIFNNDSIYENILKDRLDDDDLGLFYDELYPNDDDDDEVDMKVIGEEIASDFSYAVGMGAEYARAAKYRQSSEIYLIEPDESLGPTGLEFISPPMPLSEMTTQLHLVKEWADENGCYTNDDTGLHINISVPNYDKIDYIKLILMLGDNYLLQQFDRIGNGYTKSCIDIIRQAVQNPENNFRNIVLNKLNNLKFKLDNEAKEIFNSFGNRYVSINVHDNRVEFRSPGGDWLGKNFDKIEPALYRAVVALDAACNPQKYRTEYIKKLSKVLSTGDANSGNLISKYVAGEISKEQLLKHYEMRKASQNNINQVDNT